MVMLRFLFQLVRADFYNPVSQAIVKITNPPLVLLRRVIPGLWGIDFASIILLLALQILELALILSLRGVVPQPLGLAVLSVAELLNLAIWILIITLFVRIIISWVSPGGYNPIIALLVSLTDPLMRPARRMLPPISGLDLSPLVVFVVLQLGLMLLVQPLRHMGQIMMQ
jgi:YggT family protein